MNTAKRYPMPLPFGWFVVSYANELKIGDVKAVRYFGQDQVLFRGESGKAAMLDAYCPHLGAHLGHGGLVKKDCIECPFHAWEWDANGKVANIPYAKNIPPRAKEAKIFTYPTVEKNNLIYAWYHPNGDEPSYEVETYPEILDPDWSDNFVSSEYIVDCHIQDMAENAVDAAHFQYVHGVVSYPEFEVTYDKQKRINEFKKEIIKESWEMEEENTQTEEEAKKKLPEKTNVTKNQEEKCKLPDEESNNKLIEDIKVILLNSQTKCSDIKSAFAIRAATLNQCNPDVYLGLLAWALKINHQITIW